MTDEEYGDSLASELHSTTDARTWASRWWEVFDDDFPSGLPDHATMVGWFANAIETGRRAGREESDADVIRCGQMMLHRDTLAELQELAPGTALTFDADGTQLAVISVESLRTVLTVLDAPEDISMEEPNG